MQILVNISNTCTCIKMLQILIYYIVCRSTSWIEYKKTRKWKPSHS